MTTYEVNKFGIILNPKILLITEKGVFDNDHLSNMASICLKSATKDGKFYATYSINAHNKGMGSGVSIERDEEENFESFIKQITPQIREYLSDNPKNKPLLNAFERYLLSLVQQIIF